MPEIMPVESKVVESKPAIPQEAIFEKDGLTVEKARTLATTYKKLHPDYDKIDFHDQAQVEVLDRLSEDADKLWHELSKGTPEEIVAQIELMHRNVFYLNTSDGIEILADKAKVAGMSVLTIAAAGDFAQIFINNEARSVEVCDISLPGILYNELKLVGLRTLSFQEYQALFKVNIFMEEGWFDISAYKKLRHKISEQCRIFFDTLTEFPTGDSVVLKDPNTDFIRKRWTSDWEPSMPRCLQAVGVVVKTEAEYKTLQKRARNSKVTLRLKDINEYATEKNIPEVVYLSNVGYSPGVTAFLAEKLLAAGAKSVLMASAVERMRLADSGAGSLIAYSTISGPGTGRPGDLPGLPKDKTRKTVPIALRGGYCDPVWLEKIKQGGVSLKLNNLNTTVLGLDNRIEFGLMLEATSQEQLA